MEEDVGKFACDELRFGLLHEVIDGEQIRCYVQDKRGYDKKLHMILEQALNEAKAWGWLPQMTQLHAASSECKAVATRLSADLCWSKRAIQNPKNRFSVASCLRARVDSNRL